jgi:hypothetical protein
MTSMTRRIILGSSFLMALIGPTSADEQIVFERCFDGRGKTLVATVDGEQAELVRTVARGGRPEIRYNPAVLPHLSNNARLFFYAHQCARQGLGESASARRADCVALNVLLGNQHLRPADLPALQAELSFSGEEWVRLPGPPRQIDLSNCQPASGNVLRLPLPTQPSARQNDWNICLRHCADRLWACGKAADEHCQAAYDQCRSACRP